MNTCIQKWVSLANLYYNFLGIDVITLEQLILEGPPLPCDQHFYTVAISSFVENMLILVYNWFAAWVFLKDYEPSIILF